MFKSLFVLIALLVLPALSYGWCIGDDCYVPNPYDGNVGININVDFDVCLDTPSEFCKYGSCEQAVIVQVGKDNKASIEQKGKSFALAWQDGYHNKAEIKQDATGSTSISIQKGNYNTASINQTASQASALITQLGCGNTGSIIQK